MTNQQHPITPPRELVDKWIIQSRRQDYSSSTSADYVAIQAAQWGYEQRGADNEEKLQKARDVELVACCEEIRDGAGRVYIDESKLRVRLADDIWTARRPKPNSQAEEALESVVAIENMSDQYVQFEQDIGIIRRALKRLQELEALDRIGFYD